MFEKHLWNSFLQYLLVQILQYVHKISSFLEVLYKRDPANICWSWRRLQHVFSITILCLPRLLEDVLKTPWRHLAKTSWRRPEDVLKTCLEEVLKTCLEDVLKILWRQTKYLLGISVYLSGDNKSKCVSNKSIFHKSISDSSKANPKCIN